MRILLLELAFLIQYKCYLKITNEMICAAHDAFAINCQMEKDIA